MAVITLSSLLEYARGFDMDIKGKVAEMKLLPAARVALDESLGDLTALRSALPALTPDVTAARNILYAAEIGALMDEPAALNAGTETGDASDPRAIKEADSARVADAACLVLAFERVRMPAALQLYEKTAAILTGVLGNAGNDIIPDECCRQDVSDSFMANNAPVLAAAFAPRP